MSLATFKQCRLLDLKILITFWAWDDPISKKALELLAKTLGKIFEIFS